MTGTEGGAFDDVKRLNQLIFQKFLILFSIINLVLWYLLEKD